MLDRLFQRWLDREDPMVALLRNVPLFRDLSRRELRDVSEVLQIRSFEVGDVIFAQDVPGDGAYVVLAGCVDIYQTDAEDSEHLHLSRLESGGFFGETALLDDASRTASAVVGDEDAELALFSRNAFLTLAEQRPHLGVKVVMQLSQIVAERLRRTNRGLRSVRDEVEAKQQANSEATS